jgi:uncharacterized protein Smg (DUF494 family)
MLITFLPTDLIRQRLANAGFDEESLTKTLAYIESLPFTIQVRPDVLYFIDENGAMLHPVCFDLSSIKM